jgi:hypothetical protein
MKLIHRNYLPNGAGNSAMNDHWKAMSWVKQEKIDVVYNSF